MKKLLIATAALFLATSAMADTKVVLGCAVTTVEGSNFSNKVDPTCAFAVIGNQHSQLTVNPDGVANSGDEFQVADTAKQD
jgi:hypothetical protein